MGKGRKSGGGKDSSTIPFHYILSTNVASNVYGLVVQPASFPRVLIEADVWAHFRVDSLSFRLVPGVTASLKIAGYVGGMEDTPPGTFSAISELIPSVSQGSTQTTPTNWVRVPRVDLAGAIPWYKTIAGASATPSEEAPGTIAIYATGATDNVTLEVKGRITFKTAVANGNTPAAVIARDKVRQDRIMNELRIERDRLLKILAASSTGIPQVGGK